MHTYVRIMLQRKYVINKLHLFVFEKDKAYRIEVPMFPLRKLILVN